MPRSAMKTMKPTPQAPLQPRQTHPLLARARIPSLPRQERAVRAWITGKLQAHGLSPITDNTANLIARAPAQPTTRDAEPPILLSAHMARVLPGLAHRPILADGILRSDGSTNLGADGSAGIAIILHALDEL